MICHILWFWKIIMQPVWLVPSTLILKSYNSFFIMPLLYRWFREHLRQKNNPMTSMHNNAYCAVKLNAGTKISKKNRPNNRVRLFSKESKYLTSPQVNTVSIKREAVPMVWSQVLFTGMTKTIFRPMLKVEHFLMASTERTRWFDSVVQQAETKMNLWASPPNFRFSYWPMPQKNARWWSGR